MAKSSYDEYLKSLENDDLSYESYLASQEPEKVIAEEPEQSFESKYLDPYVYPAAEGVMKGIALAAKPASMIATPILESARNALTAARGKEYNNFDPLADTRSIINPKASSAGLMEDVYGTLGIKQQNIKELTGGIPESIRSQFPKASSFIEGLRPSDVAAMPIDAILYGKLAGPTGAAATNLALNNVANQKVLARNIIKAGSTNDKLLNNLRSSGKLEGVVQRIIDDPSLNRVDRVKVLDELIGQAKPSENQYGIMRHGTKGGKISKLASEQAQFVEKIPNDQFSFDIMEANIRAKKLLHEDSLLPGTQKAAASKIDEFLPYSQTNPEELAKIRRRSEYSKQITEINEAINAQKMEELSKLTKAQQEAILKKEAIPPFIENPNRVAGKSSLYTTEQTPSDSLSLGTPVESVSKTSRQYIPPTGEEMVWNRAAAPEKLKIVKEVERIQNEIDMLSGSVSESHPALKKLASKRDDLASKYWEIADSGFPSEEAYAEHLTDLNQQPMQVANEARIKANKYKSSLTKGTEDYNVTESAANAVEQASREAMDVGISQMPEDQAYNYYKKQSELSDLLNLKDIYSSSYTNEGGTPNLPIGGFLRGATREALSLKGKMIDPILLSGAQKMGTGAGSKFAGNAGMGGVSYSTPMIGNAMMNRTLVENLADFQVPRSTSSILSNKDMVFAKVAQATNDPAILEGLKESLSKHPDKLKSILPVLVMQFPQLFEADKYNRVDGKVFHADPMMQEKLRNDARNDVESRRDKMTNTERILILRGLNMDGSLPESIQ